MPRTCTVCAHPQRASIDHALVAGEPYRAIARRFAASPDAVLRHKTAHLPADLVRAREAEEETRALDTMAELRRCLERSNLLFDACDRWLRDADDPSRYDLGPRADDLLVTYAEPGRDGRSIRRKAPLSELVAQVEQVGRRVVLIETRRADPRELVLKTAGRLQGQLELMAKLLGDLDERSPVAILLAPEWLEIRSALLEALTPFPEARAAVADRLAALETSP
ncbi:MAG: hypothetical protein M3R02_31305 [Chloroflexota bacterium]|nr:hypothetical protein [Chloroflexota bacterium]